MVRALVNAEAGGSGIKGAVRRSDHRRHARGGQSRGCGSKGCTSVRGYRNIGRVEAGGIAEQVYSGGIQRIGQDTVGKAAEARARYVVPGNAIVGGIVEAAAALERVNCSRRHGASGEIRGPVKIAAEL